MLISPHSEQDRFKERQVDAYRKILALVPNMHDLVKRLCDTMQDNDEDLNQSHLFKFIEVVSKPILLVLVSYHLSFF